MIGALSEHPKEFSAPARNWAAEDVYLTYLEYYYRYQLFGAGFEEFRKLRSFAGYRKGAPMMLKAARHLLGNRANDPSHSRYRFVQGMM